VPATRRSLGDFGERYVQAHLTGLGYRVVALNVRLQGGEIDIVDEHEDTLVFVEVKTRRGIRFGLPQEAITRRKAVRLMGLAHRYMESLEAVPAGWRIDIVAVQIGRDGRVRRLEVFKNAVDASSAPDLA
jgi:putative endonuclease